MSKFNVTVRDINTDLVKVVTIDLPFNSPSFYVSFEPVVTPYRAWIEKLGSRLPEMSLQNVIKLVYEHSEPLYSRIEVIKLLRVIDRDLGLKEAKDIVDSIYKSSARVYQQPDFS